MKSAEEWVTALLQEHERAVKQRDTYILTGISTASHGGSHDTLFSHIVKQIQLDAWKQGMSDAEQCKPYSASVLCDDEESIYWGHGYNQCLDDYSQTIIKLRDSKTTILRNLTTRKFGVGI